MRNATFASLLCVALLAAPALAGPVVVARDPSISIAVKDRPAGEVIGTIADKAGWSLAASGDHLTRKVSVRMKNRPASEVLATVAEVAGLQTRFDSGNALVVQDARPEAPAAAPVVAVSPSPNGAPATSPPPSSESSEDQVTDKVKSKREHKGRKGHGNDRTAVGEDLEVAVGETVGDVVSTGGSVTVRGHVTGDAVAVGGSVTLEPG